MQTQLDSAPERETRNLGRLELVLRNTVSIAIPVWPRRRKSRIKRGIDEAVSERGLNGHRQDPHQRRVQASCLFVYFLFIPQLERYDVGVPSNATPPRNESGNKATREGAEKAERAAGIMDAGDVAKE